MSAIKPHKAKSEIRYRSRQDGLAAVEFAGVALVFFLVVFGIIEFARAMYVYNTLAEVTRRAAHAAANVSFNDANALNVVRKRAVLDETNGNLPFGSPITYKNVRIEYLSLPSKAFALEVIPPASMPSCPASNRVACMTDPNGSNCIRAVQARICQEETNTGSCTPVTYQPVVSLIQFPLSLPTSLTIASAGTLGYKTGETPCH